MLVFGINASIVQETLMPWLGRATFKQDKIEPNF
jgi:hypothetical protein